LKEVDQQCPGVIPVPEWKDGFDQARHERTLEAVGSGAGLGVGEGRDTVLTRLLHGDLPLYPFSSFFSSLKKRQSVPWAMSF
jgi:hypothetical protein